MNQWSTAVPDWKERILSGRSLVPDLPLFEEESAKALRIFKRLHIPDVIGKPTMAEACGPWFFDIVAALFGSYDPDTNRRMIQEFFQLIPKGNGKSSNGGAVMVTALIMNRRPEGEFLMVSTTKEIANIAFKQAKGTIKADPALDKTFHIQDHIRRITHRRTDATLQIKAADTDVITGSKALGTMIDETHEFAKVGRAEEIFTELRGALAKRPDGFLFQTTTQSKHEPSGVFRNELRRARAVRDGELDLPVLPVLYELPAEISKDGGWKNRKYWPLVNPNLGRGLDETFLVNQLTAKEQDGAAALALFASQHFNVEIGTGLRTDGWAGAEKWEQGTDSTLGLDAILAGCEVVCIGIDGGGLDDLLGLYVIGRARDTLRWLGWGKAFISPEGWERRKANQAVYQEFIDAGDLVLVERIQEDVDALVEIVDQVNRTGLLAQVGVDPAGLGIIVDALAKIGVTEESKQLVGVRQGIALMGSIKAIERKLADGTFRHADQKIMRWCAGNAIVQPTPTGMRLARDASGYGKIDPLAAMFDAGALMAMNPEVSPRVDVMAMVA